MTAKFISDRTGEVTIAVSSESKHRNRLQIGDYTPEYKETSSVGKRKLLTPDEVLRMPLDEALIILRGQNVFKVKKYDYTLHPESRHLVKRKAVAYTPVWMERTAEEQDKVFEGMKPKPKEEQPREFIAISKKELMSRKKGGE